MMFSSLISVMFGVFLAGFLGAMLAAPALAFVINVTQRVRSYRQLPENTAAPPI